MAACKGCFPDEPSTEDDQMNLNCREATLGSGRKTVKCTARCPWKHKVLDVSRQMNFICKCAGEVSSKLKFLKKLHVIKFTSTSTFQRDPSFKSKLIHGAKNKLQKINRKIFHWGHQIIGVYRAYQISLIEHGK